ncbi:MAG: acyl-CoA reductase-like NAD-dependent aldehyde dehydrogenase [Candidatus Omnitrophota bacterium]|jgi:acyl-CoA reductase-like NAD-dependent aldehyde dehydrogenase
MKLEVKSPYNHKLIKTIKMHTAAEAERMLKKALKLYKNRDGWIPASKRVAILNKLALLIKKDSNKFALLIAKEGGKPITDARIEVARAIEGVYIAAKEIAHIVKGEEIPMGLTTASQGRQAWSTREPIGVVVAVSAFNHPLNLIIHQVVPAIAVGCPIIIKPASATPLNCLEMFKLTKAAGLPEGWMQVCICNNQVAEQLVTDKRIAFFSFIGSAKIGWQLRSKLAPGVRCALEHGGVAPVIVAENVPMKSLIAPLIKGGFYHAGQVCVSVQRVFAPKKKARQLATALAKEAKKLRVGDPTKDSTEVGPLIWEREVNRVHDWVMQAKKMGAQIICGGKKLSKTTYAPTVIFDPPQDALVSNSEIFGPVVCVYPYANISSAITRANSLDVAFQAAVFSNNMQETLDIVKRLDATAVMVNDHTAFRVDWMPFGGRKSSGLGMGGIGYTMEDMTQIKMMVLKT